MIEAFPSSTPDYILLSFYNYEFFQLSEPSTTLIKWKTVFTNSISTCSIKTTCFLPEKSADAALLAASRCALNSGLFRACFDPRGVFDGGVEPSEPTRAARTGWSRPKGAVLAPVAINVYSYERGYRKKGDISTNSIINHICVPILDNKIQYFMGFPRTSLNLKPGMWALIGVTTQ